MAILSHLRLKFFRVHDLRMAKQASQNRSLLEFNQSHDRANADVEPEGVQFPANKEDTSRENKEQHKEGNLFLIHHILKSSDGAGRKR